MLKPTLAAACLLLASVAEAASSVSMLRANAFARTGVTANNCDNATPHGCNKCVATTGFWFGSYTCTWDTTEKKCKKKKSKHTGTRYLTTQATCIAWEVNSDQCQDDLNLTHFKAYAMPDYYNDRKKCYWDHGAGYFKNTVHTGTIQTSAVDHDFVKNNPHFILKSGITLIHGQATTNKITTPDTLPTVLENKPYSFFTIGVPHDFALRESSYMYFYRLKKDMPVVWVRDSESATLSGNAIAANLLKPSKAYAYAFCRECEVVMSAHYLTTEWLEYTGYKSNSKPSGVPTISTLTTTAPTDVSTSVRVVITKKEGLSTDNVTV